ncbi:MAG: hypothetical protein R2706_17845 [Acidimicrobiales bacterium]
MTTAGGWGVVTSDAIHNSTLELMTLPDDLLAQIDTLLPPRWSKNNPVDLAGGETRDTIPQVMELIASHPEVDAIIYLGLGIQSNQAAMMRRGAFTPTTGSNASSPTTNARTHDSPRPPPRSRPGRGNPSSRPPNSPPPTQTTRARRPYAPPAACVMARPIERFERSNSCGSIDGSSTLEGYRPIQPSSD